MGVGVANLRELSARAGVDAEEALDALFPGNPLLCVGREATLFATVPREDLRGEAAALPLIVPSPMSARTGMTLEGKESAHALDNTGPQRFLIVEADPKKWPDLPEVERQPFLSFLDPESAYYATKFDEQAAILLHLAKRAPLALAVHSGKRSIHGWLYCAGQPEGSLWQFMNEAVTLGADSRMWVRSQFVRMPGCTRQESGARQEIYYFNPRVIQ